MQDVLRLIPNWNWKRGVVILVLMTFSTLLFITPTVASAEEGEPSQSSEAGLGIASGLLTIVYFPFKVAYAVLGGAVGGLVYLVSGANTDTAKTVWEPSFYGTYVITPSHLRGDQPVRFVGVSPYEEERQEEGKEEGKEEIQYDEEAYEQKGKEELKLEIPDENAPKTEIPVGETPTGGGK